MKWHHLSKLPIAFLLLAGGFLFCTGIGWGLPGPGFGWSGQKILDLAGERTLKPGMGTDVDVDAIADRTRPIVLNDTDHGKAVILRRYHLYSNNPDEMITMMALARIRPTAGQLDPGIYQYGGLWIYPVGALIKLASLTPWLTLKPDLAYYLDWPSRFGAFYVVARLYTAAWGLLGIWVVYRLALNATGSLLGAAATATAFLSMPAVIIAAHEAKPHLPGVVLMLLAILAATKFLVTHKQQWWWATCLFCGCAISMILTAWPILLILPVIRFLHRDANLVILRNTLSGWLLAAGIYALTNPYVIWHLANDPAMLRSNLGNTAAMFTVSLNPLGMLKGVWMLVQGIGIVPLICLAALWFAARQARTSPPRQNRPLVDVPDFIRYLTLAPAIIVLLLFLLTAHDKFAEHVRFALFPIIVMMLIAGRHNALRLRDMRFRQELTIMAMIAMVLMGCIYAAAFSIDSRRATGQEIRDYQRAGVKTIGMQAEPAPYIMPRINPLETRLVLLPKGRLTPEMLEGIDLVVGPAELQPGYGVPGYTLVRSALPWYMSLIRPSMNWADKSFFILLKDYLVRSGS